MDEPLGRNVGNALEVIEQSTFYTVTVTKTFANYLFISPQICCHSHSKGT